MQSVDKTASDPFLAQDYNDLRADVIANDAKIHFAYNFKDGTPFLASTFGSGSPSNTFDSAGMLKQSTGTANGSGSSPNATVRFRVSAETNDQDIYDFDPYILVTFRVGSNLGTGDTKRWWMVFGGPLFNNALTSKHFGFEVRCDDGTEKLFATWGDGSTHSEQELTISPAIDGNVTNVYRCYAKLFSGSQIVFYVNGSVVHTATTDLPAGDITALDSAATVIGLSIQPTVGTNNFDGYISSLGFGWSGV